MKKMIGLFCLPMLALAGDSQPDNLDWLSGCWTTPGQNEQEVWVKDENGDMAGFSVALTNGRVGFYEVLHVRRNGDGHWIYTAYPSGQAATSFVVTDIGEQSIRFTNPDHDYPQEIRYHREGDALYATISLLDGVEPRHFNKVACD